MSDNTIEYIQGNKNIFQSGSMQVNIYGQQPADACPETVQEPLPVDEAAAAKQPAAASAEEKQPAPAAKDARPAAGRRQEPLFELST